VDILVNNAGVLDAKFNLTPRDKIESHFAINHLGHFVFTTTILPCLQKGARIVNVTSYAQTNPKAPNPILFDRINDERAMGGWMERYGHSKLANVLFTRSLQSRLGSEYYVNCCHPGQVGTELNRTVTQDGILGYVIRFLMLLLDQPVEIGALTQLYLATSPEVVEKKIQGEYYVSIARRSMDSVNPVALNEDLAEELWNYSQRVVDEKVAS
jgi:NAD(P)-dependent dehydrogenase (short-subunit alcohol dehydrogenase family)